MTQADEFNEALRGSGETILLIDDEPSFVEITKILLNLAGYEVLTASNGIEGVDVFKNYLQNVNVVICDLNMPKLGGNQLLQTLLSINPQIRILIISGSILDEDIPLFLMPGKIEFLRKPFHNKTLLEAIKSLLQQH